MVTDAHKYRLGERLGGGGMAEVFAASVIGVEGFERPVAVKRVLPAFCAEPGFARMFVAEARIASLMNHPNLVAVYDFDRDAEGRFFLVMERVDGVDLRRLLQHGALEPAVAAHVAAETLRGLAHAHELSEGGRPLRIVHRDVSPHNVLCSWEGAVKVSDFGIARAFALTGATRPGTLKGKLGYMSPEQARGESLDARSDLFSTGVVLHEMLCGRRLFTAPSDAEAIARMLYQPIPSPRDLDPALPEDLDRFVMRLLERDLDRRCPSARAALDELLSCSAPTPRGAGALAGELRRRFPSRPARSSARLPMQTRQGLAPTLLREWAEQETAPPPEEIAFVRVVTRTASSPLFPAPTARRAWRRWVALSAAALAAALCGAGLWRSASGGSGEAGGEPDRQPVGVRSDLPIVATPPTQAGQSQQPAASQPRTNAEPASTSEPIAESRPSEPAAAETRRKVGHRSGREPKQRSRPADHLEVEMDRRSPDEVPAERD
jgi:serine/threonine protein kinase